MALFTHEFEAPLELHGVGKSRVIWYHVLFMPPALALDLPLKTHPRLRVRGEIVDIPVGGAWMPCGDGRQEGGTRASGSALLVSAIPKTLISRLSL